MSNEPSLAYSATPATTATPTGGLLVPTPQEHPTGTTLIRLADIPLNVRRTAALRLMRQTDDTAEWIRYFELVFEPGSASGRVTT